MGYLSSEHRPKNQKNLHQTLLSWSINAYSGDELKLILKNTSIMYFYFQ